MSTIESLESRRFLSAGGVDPYFGNSGRVVLWTDEVRPEDAAMLVYPDGRILTVVSDRLNPETREMHVRRLNSDGSPDMRFNGNGSVVIQFPSFFSDATHLGLTGDGRVVVSDGDHIARLRANGSLDPTFGTGGILDLPIPTSDIAVLSDGSLLVLTTPTDQPEVVFDAFQLLRFGPDGSPDSTYGNGGNVIATIPPLLAPQPDSVPTIFELELVTSPDGSAFALCRFDESIADTDEDVNGIYIARFTPAGAPDTRFNGTGALHLADRAPNNRRDVLPDDTKIERFAARLTPDGQVLVLVDTSWEDVAFRVSDRGDVVPNPAPARIVDPGDPNHEDGPLAIDALVTRDGGVVVGRRFLGGIGEGEQFRLHKWNSAGAPVAEFDTAAPVITALGDTLQLASAADGSILLLDNEFKNGGKVLVLRRLWSDGAPVGGASAAIIREAGPRSQVITVTYRDDERLDISTFDGRDIRVSGPDGFAAFAKFDSIVKRRGEGGWFRVRYKLAAPGGAWDASDNGTYRLQLRAGQVFDNDGRAATAGRIGAFNVNIAASPSSPPSSRSSARVAPPSPAPIFANTRTIADNLFSDTESLI